MLPAQAAYRDTCSSPSHADGDDSGPVQSNEDSLKCSPAQAGMILILALVTVMSLNFSKGHLPDETAAIAAPLFHMYIKLYDCA